MQQVPLFEQLNCDEGQIMDLARRIAPLFRSGDMLLLVGDLGAGKSFFARALIRALCDEVGLEVPSPTFSLMQSYVSEKGLPIWHLDLYRLEGPDDVYDLGLEDELEEAFCIVEWPDRLPVNWQACALTLTLFIQSEGERRFLLSGDKKTWQARIGAALGHMT